MQKEIYAVALKNALTEISNLSNDVTCSFMFTREGELVAGDERKPEKLLEKAMLSLEDVFEKANTVGTVKSLEIEGTNGRIQISCVNDMYLATVMTNKADMKYVETVARVIIPTLLKILENVSPAPLKNRKKNNPLTKEEKTEEIEEPVPAPLIEPQPKLPKENPELPEPIIEPPTSQLLVETMKGLLVRADSVQIDADTLAEWTELYEDKKKIEEVEIETFAGKTSTFKVKPINDSKLTGRGLVRIPEKTCQSLDIRKGELVKVRPVILEEGEN